MERPRNISSGEAMSWNEDVERRRREYHAMRCSEDPIYRYLAAASAATWTQRP